MKYSHLTRIYFADSLTTGENIIISGENFHYIYSVMRIKKGHSLRIFNEKDGEFLAIIDDLSKSELVIRIEEFLCKPRTEKSLTLALCIIKPDRFTESVKAAVQIGVTRIIPVISERVQLQKLAYDRFEKIILQSTQQAERFKPAEIMEAVKLEELLQLPKIGQIIFACESEDETKAIKNIKNWSDNVTVLVGPEGGFTKEEIDFLKNNPLVTAVSLGQNVLRAEVAASYALSCVHMMRE